MNRRRGSRRYGNDRQILQLNAGDRTVAIENDASYTPDSTDNVRSFDRHIALGSSSNDYISSRHSVTLLDGDQILASVILLAGGGASAVHEHSAIVIDDSCFVAVGPYVVSLDLPTLELRWSTETDSATCFGIYYSAPHGLLISHGELEISALKLSGTLLWASAGADIFTNGFELLEHKIRVRDFCNRDYVFDIATGAEIVT